MKYSAYVTVVMPAHDAQRWIHAAISSVLNQTWKDFELWILENGSTDNTANIARSFDDPRIRVFELGPIGFQKALQYAIENAKSPWLARMDADDISFPERLAQQVRVLSAEPDCVFVGTDFAHLTPSGHIIEQLPTAESCFVDAKLLGSGARRFGDPTVVFNRQAARDVGGVDSEFTMGDVPLLFRLLKRGKAWQIGCPLYLYRHNQTSMSSNLAFREQAYRARVKYAPECLLNLAQPRKSSFWSRIALWEILAGDRDAARVAIQNMEKQEGFIEGARKLHVRSWLGPIAPPFYRYKYRHKWRHRPDWEKSLCGYELSG